MCVFVSVSSAVTCHAVTVLFTTAVVCECLSPAAGQNVALLHCGASKCPLERRAFYFTWGCSYRVEMYPVLTQTDFFSPALAGISIFPIQAGK